MESDDAGDHLVGDPMTIFFIGAGPGAAVIALVEQAFNDALLSEGPCQERDFAPVEARRAVYCGAASAVAPERLQVSRAERRWAR